MKIQSLPSLLVTGACVALSACAAQPGDSDPFEADDLDVPLETADGGDVKNGTGPDGMFLPSITTMIQDLQWASLDGGEGKLRVTPTMASAPQDVRKKVLGNLVRCALGDADTLLDPIDSTPHKGHVGLASSWKTSPLTSLSARRFVSACILQHLNGLGFEVLLLLEGNTPKLKPNAEQRQKFPVTDAAIWGDLFVKPQQLYACALPDLTEACAEAAWIQGINKRICDSSPDCHLNVVGACSANCVEDPTTKLWSCPAWGYTEVISSRTKPEDGAYVCLP